MTSPQSLSLDTILQSLSKDIWERLRDVSALPTAYSVRFGEETITDIMMLDLNRQGLTRAIFVQTPKSKEALAGTDFEWWLGSDATGWIRLAVQAKKIHLGSGRYPNLKHPVKGVSQIDLLEQFAARQGAIPLYCLYNYTDIADSSRHWHCCQRPFQEEELGCTITPSSNIKQSIRLWGAKNFDFVHSQMDTIPWRCLALCPRVRALFHQGQEGMSQLPIPLFGTSPRLYSRLPDRLRVETDDVPRRSRRVLQSEELDRDLYDPEVGFPRRISVLELNA